MVFMTPLLKHIKIMQIQPYGFQINLSFNLFDVGQGFDKTIDDVIKFDL